MATLTEAQVKVLRLAGGKSLVTSGDLFKIGVAHDAFADIVPTLIEATLTGFPSCWHITDAGRAALAAYDTEQALKQHGAHDAGTVDGTQITALRAEYESQFAGELRATLGWSPSYEWWLEHETTLYREQEQIARDEKRAVIEENEALKQRVAALEDALRPIADVVSGGDLDGVYDSEVILVDPSGGNPFAIAWMGGNTLTKLRVRHLREAAQVLGE